MHSTTKKDAPLAATDTMHAATNTIQTVSPEGKDPASRFVAAHLGFVRKKVGEIVSAYAADLDEAERQDLYDECLQEGVLGLRRAAELYDESFKTKPTTYAGWWVWKRAGAVAREWSETRRHISLDAPVDEEGDASRLDLTPDENAESPFETVARSLLSEELRDLLDALPPRERAMVEMRFGFTTGEVEPYHEVGAAFSVATQRAEFIVKRALARLRSLARERDFDPAA